MNQIQLPEGLFKEAERRAREAGFTSVDEFIVDRLEADFAHENLNLDCLFTPERLARISKAEAEIEAGHFFTDAQAEHELARLRAKWKQKSAS